MSASSYIPFTAAVDRLRAAGGVDVERVLRDKVRRIPGERPKRGGTPPWLYHGGQVEQLAAWFSAEAEYWPRLATMPLRQAVCQAWLDGKGWDVIGMYLPVSPGEAIDIVIADLRLHRCAACSALLPESAGQVCKACVRLYGSAKAALHAAGVVEQPKEVTHNRPQIKDNEARRLRLIICAALRQEFAERGEVLVNDFTPRFDCCKATIKRCLHEIMRGDDGQPPLDLRIPKGGRRDCVWKLAS